MRWKRAIFPAAFAVIMTAVFAMADRITLRDGTAYSGEFIRGDSRTIEFRILGRVEIFKFADVADIVFGSRDAEPAAVEPEKAAAAPAAPVTDAPAAEERLRPQRAVDASRQGSPGSSVTIAKGMSLTVRTTAEIDTDRNRVGDPFEAILDENLVSGTRTVAARGAPIKGKIAYAQESGKLTGQSQLILELTEIGIDGKTYPLHTSDYTEVGASRGNRTAAAVGGTAAVGAIIGAIAGGGRGAAIGAASGAAVGTGVQVITKGEVLRIPAETVLEFRLESPLTIDVR